MMLSQPGLPFSSCAHDGACAVNLSLQLINLLALAASRCQSVRRMALVLQDKEYSALFLFNQTAREGDIFN